MNMSSREADIAQRAEFYRNPEVARFLSRDGVPKDKKAMMAMISAGMHSEKSNSDAETQKLVDCLGFVVFAVHPQQINVRDKANGQIITVISR
jgi:hypothetical protein